MSSNSPARLSLAIASLLATPGLSGAEPPVLETLHAFAIPANSSENPARNPFGGLVLAGDGNLYGTTSEGGGFYDSGQYHRGTLFRLTPTGEVTTVHAFAVTSPSGWWPNGQLCVANDSTLYGVTLYGGTDPTGLGTGTIFSFSLPAGGFAQRASFFSGTSGSLGGSRYGLVQGNDGRFYGLAGGGAYSEELPGRAPQASGSVYAVTTNGVFSILRSFAGGVAGAAVPPNVPEGTYPKGQLVKGPGGHFYGVTAFDGLNGHGTCFRITADGELTTIAAFNGRNGSRPEAGLIWGTDGNLYGATSGGGTVTNDAGTGFGTVFKLSPTGELSTLHSFDYFNDGSLPQAELVEKNGAFYGSTRGGPISTIFRVSANGDFAKLAEFPSAGGVDDNVSKLTVGSDGNLYGTIAMGGPLGGGTVFRINLPGPPTITDDPSSQTVAPGSPVTFSVTATGASPLRYQWTKEGTVLPGQTNVTLTLNHAQVTDVGGYAVNVSNLGGSATSKSAVLSLLNLDVYPGLTIVGRVGARYRIDYSLEVDAANWLPLTEVDLPVTPYTFGDFTAPANAKRFYRAVLVQ